MRRPGVLVALTALLFAPSYVAFQNSANGAINVTVSEGTSMSVAVSPDG